MASDMQMRWGVGVLGVWGGSFEYVTAFCLFNESVSRRWPHTQIELLNKLTLICTWRHLATSVEIELHAAS